VSAIKFLIDVITILSTLDWVKNKAKIAYSKIMNSMNEEMSTVHDDDQRVIKRYFNQLIDETMNSLPQDRLEIEKIVDDLAQYSEVGAHSDSTDTELFGILRFGLRAKLLHESYINHYDLEFCPECGDLLDFKEQEGSCRHSNLIFQLE